MAHRTHQVRAALRHFTYAGNRHDVHSPFVFDLVERALRKPSVPEDHSAIEALRSGLLKDSGTIQVTDLGAGSSTSRGPLRRIRDIARTALKPPAQAAMLCRIARHVRPSSVLELGTCFGITTLYLAKGAAEAQIHTIEGCPAIAAVARDRSFGQDADRIHLHVGAFREQLPEVLHAMDRLDLAFIDGHHAEEPTLWHFEQCLTRSHNTTVIILDDIHWSPGMDAAWRAIQAHPRVTVTIDLLHLGIVLLRKEQQREHFLLRY